MVVEINIKIKICERTIVPPGGESRIRENTKPRIDPKTPKRLALYKVLLKVLETTLELMTGTTITAEISNNPVIVIDLSLIHI